MPWLMERGQCPSCRDCVVGPPPHFYRDAANGGQAREVVGSVGADGRQLSAENRLLGQTNGTTNSAWGNFVSRFRGMNRGINRSRAITQLLSEEEQEANAEDENREVEL